MITGAAMTTLPKIDTDFMLEFLTELLNTPSPTGFTDQAIDLTEQDFESIPFSRYPADP